MAGVLYHRFKEGEETTRNALQRLLFNSWLVGAALLAVLVIFLLLLTQSAQ